MALEYEFDALVQLLQSPAWEQRRDAAEDLGAWRAPEAIPYLLPGLNDPVGAVQYATAVALGQIGTPAVVQTLLACLDNPNFRFPAAVLEALGNLRIKEAVPYYIRYLRDPDVHVRGVAHKSLTVSALTAKGFRATADEEKREVAVRKWETWWTENEATFEVGKVTRKKKKKKKRKKKA